MTLDGSPREGCLGCYRCENIENNGGIMDPKGDASEEVDRVLAVSGLRFVLVLMRCVN